MLVEISPFRLLPFSSTSQTSGQFRSFHGISPSRLLFDKSKCVMFCRRPTSGGIDPLSLLFRIWRILRERRSPTSAGKLQGKKYVVSTGSLTIPPSKHFFFSCTTHLPLNLFHERSMLSRFVHDHNPLGIGPVRVLLLASKLSSESRKGDHQESSCGSVPVNLLLPRWMTLRCFRSDKSVGSGPSNRLAVNMIFWRNGQCTIPIGNIPDKPAPAF